VRRLHKKYLHLFRHPHIMPYRHFKALGWCKDCQRWHNSRGHLRNWRERLGAWWSPVYVPGDTPDDCYPRIFLTAVARHIVSIGIPTKEERMHREWKD
jgi:hypothetical protein